MYNHHIVGKKIFSEKDCQEIIDFAISQCKTKESSIVTEDIKEAVIDKNIRNVTSYVPPDSEEMCLPVLQYFVPPLYNCNEQYFKFDLSDRFEFNILKYEVNGHYEVHCDCDVGDAESHKNISTRKLSFSFILNKDYEGGDLEFPGLPNSYLEEGDTLERGDCIMFPSYFYHKVKPVTSGTRWALVGWIHGDKPLR